MDLICFFRSGLFTVVGKGGGSSHANAVLTGKVLFLCI
jgi:hypothetical protein